MTNYQRIEFDMMTANSLNSSWLYLYGPFQYFQEYQIANIIWKFEHIRGIELSEEAIRRFFENNLPSWFRENAQEYTSKYIREHHKPEKREYTEDDAPLFKDEESVPEVFPIEELRRKWKLEDEERQRREEEKFQRDLEFYEHCMEMERQRELKRIQREKREKRELILKICFPVLFLFK